MNSVVFVGLAITEIFEILVRNSVDNGKVIRTHRNCGEGLKPRTWDLLSLISCYKYIFIIIDLFLESVSVL